jgi:hypothetical protein
MLTIEPVQKADYPIQGLRPGYVEEVLAAMLGAAMRDADGNQAAGVALALKRAFYTGFKTGRDVEFAAWLGKLSDELISPYGYTAAQAKEYVLDQPGEWREFFNDDYTPADAAAEDQRAGAE